MSVPAHTTGAGLGAGPPGGTTTGTAGRGTTGRGTARRGTSAGGLAGRTIALLAAAAQIVAVFLPWGAQAAALDLTLRRFEVGAAQPTAGAVLVLLAGVPAVAALVSDVGWPRLLSALGTGALVLAWLARGPEGTITVGVAVALGAAVAHLLAAALARGPAVPGPAPRRPGGPRGSSAPTGGAARGAAGHRELDHTADTAFEAWGPTRAACFGAAVQALVDSFADTAGAPATGRHEVALEPADDEDLLVDLLDEVIYVLDTRGAVPVGGRIRDRDDGGIAGYLELADVDAVRPGGAVPKAITYHGLAVTGGADGWRCRVTIDV